VPFYSAKRENEANAAHAAEAIVWVVLVVRHLVVAAIFLELFIASAADASRNSDLAYFGTLAVFPLVGIVGAGLALWGSRSRRRHLWGTVGGALSLVGSIMGPAIIGVFAITLSAMGVLLHRVRRPSYQQRQAAEFGPPMLTEPPIRAY